MGSSAAMKALVIGASGFLGGALLRVGQTRGNLVGGTFHQYAMPNLVHLDSTSSEAVAACLGTARPAWVLLPAAIPNVELCETHPTETWRVNVEAVGHVAHTCRDVGARLVYFSSDYVFDGTAGPYRET